MKKVCCKRKSTSPAANASHIDYETEMILFIVESDSAAGKPATNEKYRTAVNLMIVSPHTRPYEKSKFYERSSHLIEWIWINISAKLLMGKSSVGDRVVLCFPGGRALEPSSSPPTGLMSLCVLFELPRRTVRVPNLFPQSVALFLTGSKLLLPALHISWRLLQRIHQSGITFL